MGKKRLSAKERRNQIISKVKELCAKKGFAGTTLDEIAKGAGVSRALVIQLFGNKENIYKELLIEVFKDHPMEKDVNLIGYIQKQDDLGVFLSYAEHIYNNMTKKDSLLLKLILFSMLEKPEIYRYHFQNRRLKGLKVIEDYIVQGIAKGKFKNIDAHHIALCFSSMVMYVLLEKITLQDKLEKNEVMDIIKTGIISILNGIKRRDEK